MSDYTEDTIADSEGAEQRSVKASISLPDFLHVKYRLDDFWQPNIQTMMWLLKSWLSLTKRLVHQ